MRPLLAAAALTAAAGIALGAYGITTPTHLQPPIPAPGAERAGPHRTQTPSRSAAAAAPTTPRSEPVRIAVPSIGISSVLGPARGRNPDDTIADAPLSGPIWSLPWWYDDGPSPGQSGSAVLLGHVDSAQGAGHLGVFFRLGDLRDGQRIDVTLANGSVTRWVVTSVRLYRDGHFPDATVYDPTGPAVLRLVTCGGTFDWQTHDYESATVVTARPATPGPRR